MEIMTTISINKKQVEVSEEIKMFRMKSGILDEFLELIEDKYLGYLMELTEKEPDISLVKAKKRMV